MGILDTILTSIGFRAASTGSGTGAASTGALPPVPLPKAPKGPQALPGDRLTARDLGTTSKVVRELVKSSPDLSAATSFLLRTGIPEKYTVVAKDLDGTINVEVTSLANQLLRRGTYLGNVDGSFGTQQGLQSLSEQLSLELLMDGAACLEVALDKARIPASFNPVSVTTLRQYEDGPTMRLVQYIGGVEIDLDLPTIIYTTVDKFQTDAYPSGYLESAIQPALADVEFNNDMRRALKRAVIPRMKASIDFEKVKKMAPPAVLQDPTKFTAYLNTLISEIQTVVNNSAPEDTYVTYDSVTYSYIDGGQDPSAIIAKIQEVLNGKLASGSKTLPVILGHGNGSTSSSTEALLYIKQANMLRVKLNEIYSRALSIAVRIMGQDCYVEFNYAPLDLRPDAELETFRAVKQSRIIELLSLGLLTDEQASLELTGELPPAGFKPLSGTQFKTAAAQIPGNAASNTSAKPVAGTTAAPTGVKSQNNKA